MKGYKTSQDKVKFLKLLADFGTLVIPFDNNLKLYLGILVDTEENDSYNHIVTGPD